MPIHVEYIDNDSKLDASMLQGWANLSIPSPMQSAHWLLRWWATFGQNERSKLCLLMIYENNELVGIAPWYTDRDWSGGKTLRFLGDGLICSDHSSVLTIPERASVVRDAVSAWLHENVSIVWDSMQFSAIDANDIQLQHLVAMSSEQGYSDHKRETTGCWSTELPNSWDDYLASLSKNHRKRCRRWSRTYIETGRLRVHRASPHDVNEYWNRLSILNKERRDAIGDRSSFLDEQFHQFHLSVLPEMVENGNAELIEVEIDGVHVASEYILVNDDTMFCYQSGMSKAENRDGFGNLSILALFREAIARGFKRLDFLRGDEDYKSHWGATKDACVDYHVASDSLSSRVRVGCYSTLDWARAVTSSLISSP